MQNYISVKNLKMNVIFVASSDETNRYVLCDHFQSLSCVHYCVIYLYNIYVIYVIYYINIEK